jgi:ribulose-phosphate 3-epimerase
MNSCNSLILAPSLLGANHGNLAQAAQLIVDEKLEWLHFDVMDGHFVPNINFGPKTLEDVHRNVPSLFYDVHLMLQNPQHYIEPFVQAGADLISIHIEPDYDHRKTLQHIRDLNCLNGIVINPGTSENSIYPLLEYVDLVLVMTVQPGYGGQSFREDMLPKIKQIHEWRQEQNLTFRIEVDGGIDMQTAEKCKLSGADTFVAGTAFFREKDKQAFISSICNR